MTVNRVFPQMLTRKSGRKSRRYSGIFIALTVDKLVQNLLLHV